MAGGGTRLNLSLRAVLWLSGCKTADPFIRGLVEIGIVMIMFALGFEEQTDNFLASIKKSWGLAFFAALAPFITAYSVAFYSIGPVFFIELGTKLVFDWDIFMSVIPQTAIMTLGLFFAQISSAALAELYLLYGLG